MALVKCNECGKMVSSDAGACPQCGKPVEIPQAPEPAPVKKSLAGPIIGVLVILGALGFFAYKKYSGKIADAGKKTAEKVEKEIKETVEAVNPNKKPVPVVLTDAPVELKEDRFGPIPITLEKKSLITIEYTVLSGKGLEIFTLDEKNFSAWKKDQETKVIPIKKLSSACTDTGTLSTDLPAGKYVVVVDMTNSGEVKPRTNFKTDVVKVQLKITQLESE